MAERHPTIPGVTVSEARLQWPFTAKGEPSVYYWQRTLDLSHAHIIVTASTRTKNVHVGKGIPPAHAEAVAAMIRDQVDWLKQQEARNE